MGEGLEEKFDKLHGAFVALDKSHGVLATELTAVKDTLVRLADVNGELVAIRAESLHLLKMHDECKKANRIEHDELFLRLRTLESRESACAQDRKALREKVSDNEDDLEALEKDVEALQGKMGICAGLETTVSGLSANWRRLSWLVAASALGAVISAGGFIWVVLFRLSAGGPMQ